MYLYGVRPCRACELPQEGRARTVAHRPALGAVGRNGMAEAKAGMEGRGTARAACAGRSGPDEMRTRMIRAISLARAGDYEGALRTCTTVRGSGRAAADVVRGFALHCLGRHADALATFDRAAEIDPRCGAARLGRARALARLGRPDDAMESFHEAARISPGSATIRADLALVAVRLGCYDDAVSMYRDAVRLAPGDGDVHAGLAFALAGVGRIDDAWTSCGRAAEVSPMSSRPSAARGRILAGLGRYADALAAFDRAVSLDPASASAHSGRGIALAGLGRYADALAAFDRAVSLDPASASAHSGRGIALEHMGRPDEARSAFENAIGVDQHHEMAMAGRRRLGPAGNAGAVDAADSGTTVDRCGYAPSATTLGRAIEPDFGREFDRIGNEIESALLRIARYGSRGRGREGSVSRGRYEDSPPLTPEELADVRESLAEFMATDVGRGER